MFLLGRKSLDQLETNLIHHIWIVREWGVDTRVYSRGKPQLSLGSNSNSAVAECWKLVRVTFVNTKLYTYLSTHTQPPPNLGNSFVFNRLMTTEGCSLKDFLLKILRLAQGIDKSHTQLKNPASLHYRSDKRL